MCELRKFESLKKKGNLKIEKNRAFDNSKVQKLGKIEYLTIKKIEN